MTPDKPKPAKASATAGQGPSKSAATGLPGMPKPPLPGPPSAPKAPAPVAGPLPPLFRRVDWLAFGLTTLLVFIGYYLTLAPDLTLEDSGELAVGSFYAGVPHPPGYPVWTLYTWLFTLLPVSNIAYRVAISSAVAGAIASGLLALMVSRGSSMMLEGVTEFKNIERRWENLICLVSGFVAGMLMGFNGFMWSQAVIVEVYTLSVLSLTGVLCCLLRWLYAPSQRRYLYLGFFLFGICFNNHQSLIVAAMAIEVAVTAVQAKLGRDLFFGNVIFYLLGLVANLSVLQGNVPLQAIYHVIGLGSIAACAWLTIKTKKLFTEWKSCLISLGAFLLGASFYLYMAVASMTNPPMNWGYPRTVTGFVHAFTRGQYERIHPTAGVGTTTLEVLGSFFSRFTGQVLLLKDGVVLEFSWVYILIGLIPFLFFTRLQVRERAWIIGLSAFYFVLGPGLLILLNPATDRQSLDLNKPFFTASHVLIAMAIGYGLTLLGGTLLTQYQKFRFWILGGIAVAVAFALYALTDTLSKFFGDQSGSGIGLLFKSTGQAFALGQYRPEVYAAYLL
ncbi:MAG TPA: DUF2723 domain-containing protein, partial [Candidatus Eisenbacteria bacterium]|nr:DUF2723 domain-containing protein [Candidatus Eisenbacteria bacterium]